MFVFFFNDTATTEIYTYVHTRSLHDALPICGFLYAGSGIVGALAGSTIGKAIDGQKLLFLFALLMLVVGVLMLRGRDNPGIEGAACNRHNAPKVLGYGLGTGGFSGFFGMIGRASCRERVWQDV